MCVRNQTIPRPVPEATPTDTWYTKSTAGANYLVIQSGVRMCVETALRLWCNRIKTTVLACRLDTKPCQRNTNLSRISSTFLISQYVSS